MKKKNENHQQNLPWKDYFVGNSNIFKYQKNVPSTMKLLTEQKSR